MTACNLRGACTRVASVLSASLQVIGIAELLCIIICTTTRRLETTKI
jgi:hypothetical protein